MDKKPDLIQSIHNKVKKMAEDAMEENRKNTNIKSKYRGFVRKKGAPMYTKEEIEEREAILKGFIKIISDGKLPPSALEKIFSGEECKVGEEVFTVEIRGYYGALVYDIYLFKEGFEHERLFLQYNEFGELLLDWREDARSEDYFPF